MCQWSLPELGRLFLFFFSFVFYFFLISQVSLPLLRFLVWMLKAEVYYFFSFMSVMHNHNLNWLKYIFCRLLVISGTSFSFMRQTGRGQCCIFVLKFYTGTEFPWSTGGRWCCPASPSQCYIGSQHPASLLGYSKVTFQLEPKYCVFWNTV